jgi:hypothetical protein
MPALLRPRLLRGFFALALLWSGSAQAADSETQGWSTAQVQFRASPSDFITMDVSQRFREQKSGDEQQLFRVAYDRLIAPGVQIGGGIAYLEAEAEREHRLFQQFAITKGLFMARTRLEQRFFDTAGTPLLRLRQRVQLALPLDPAKRVTVILAVEGMANLNRARPSDKRGFATLRNQIGLRYSLNRHLDAQLLYMRQQNIRDARPDAVAHIPWLTLGWRI